MSEVSGPTLQVQSALSFESLLSSVLPQLDARLLRRLRATVDELLFSRERQQAEPEVDEKERQRRAAVERSRRSRELSKGNREIAARGMDALMKQIGAEHVEPIGPENLTALMIQDGIRPEDNIASREILRMREE